MAKTVVQQQTATPPATINPEDALMEQYAGAGISNKASDNIVQQISILQPLSPEIVEGKLPDAKAGDFLMGSVVIPAQTGIWFQPCYWDQRFFEFQPLDQGGGFIATHEWRGEHNGQPILPNGATRVDDFHFKMGEHELIHYRQWSGFAWINKQPMARVINFKSTGHTVARNWNTAAGEANRLPTGEQRALFGHIYHLTTERRTNSKGTWFQLRVGNPVLLSAAAAMDVVPNFKLPIELGANLRKAFIGGELRAETDANLEQRDQQQGPM